jgi:hypothetical protein
MPRKSIAALTTVPASTPVPIRPDPPRLHPPPSLSNAERVIWRRVMASAAGMWIRSGQEALLAAYCSHAARSDELRALISECDPRTDLDSYATLLRLLSGESARVVQLGRALRISPHARTKAETAGRAARDYREPIDDGQAIADLIAARRKGAA